VQFQMIRIPMCVGLDPRTPIARGYRMALEIVRAESVPLAVFRPTTCHLDHEVESAAVVVPPRTRAADATAIRASIRCHDLTRICDGYNDLQPSVQPRPRDASVDVGNGEIALPQREQRFSERATRRRGARGVA